MKVSQDEMRRRDQEAAACQAAIRQLLRDANTHGLTHEYGLTRQTILYALKDAHRACAVGRTLDNMVAQGALRVVYVLDE